MRELVLRIRTEADVSSALSQLQELQAAKDKLSAPSASINVPGFGPSGGGGGLTPGSGYDSQLMSAMSGNAGAAAERKPMKP